jgi:hypothetical protein
MKPRSSLPEVLPEEAGKNNVRLPIGPFRLLRPVAPRFRYGYEIINALNNYPEKFEAQKTWDELGKPATTLREFAQNL